MSDDDEDVQARRQEILDAYERLAQQSHFETLGVSESATEHEIKQAFFQKAKKFHPDQYRDPAFADLADRIEALFMRVGGAYEVLRDPQSRQSYEAGLRRRRGSDTLPRVTPAPVNPPPPDPAKPPDNLIDTPENASMAEEAIHRAERLIADTKTWDAIQLLQAVIPRIFGRKQRDRARVLLAKAYIKNPNWLRRGEQLLQTVIQEDPQNAEAHFALGMLYKEMGLSSRAVSMFRTALELRPDHKPSSVFAEGGKERRLAVGQLAALEADVASAVEALEGELTAEEREHIRAAVGRAKRACHEGELEELNASLQEMEMVTRQLKQQLQTFIGALASDTLRSFRQIETRLSSNERQRVLISLDQATKLRHGGPSAGFVETIRRLREVLRWLKQLRSSH